MRYTVLYVGFGRIVRREDGDTDTSAGVATGTCSPYDDRLLCVRGQDKVAEAVVLVLPEASLDLAGDLQSAGRLVSISAESTASRVSRAQADAAAEEILAARPALAITPLPGFPGPEVMTVSSPLLLIAKAAAATLLAEGKP